MENPEQSDIKLSSEEPSKTKRILKIEVPTVAIEQEFQKTYKALQKTAKFPGFRPGKVPLQMVRKMMGQKVQEDLLQRVVPFYYAKAVEKAALDPVDMPIIRNIQLQEGEPFQFEATVYIKPDFEVKDYKGLPKPGKEVEIKEELVEKILEDMRERYAELSSYEDQDHAAARGDVVEADFQGFMDDEPMDGGKGENHLIEIGAGRLIAELEEGFIGMKKEERKEIEAAFPEDYHAKNLAGKKVLFKVHVKDIKQKKLPELDDEFAKDLGEKFSTLEELRKDIKENIREREEKKLREELHLDIMDEVLRRNPIEEIPEIMVSRQKKSLKDNLEKQIETMSAYRDTAEMKEMLDDEKLEAKARRDVTWSFILDQIAEKEGITVDQEDLEAELERRAWESSMTKEVLRDLYIQQAGSLEPLRLTLKNEKILDFLLENAKVMENKGSEDKDTGEE